MTKTTSSGNKLPACSALVVAIDVEARGPSALRHGILALGVALGSADVDLVHDHARVNFAPMNGQTYDAGCLEDFWKHHPQVRADLEKDPFHPIEAITSFRKLLDSLEAENGFLRIVSDNPAFDFHFVNTYLDHAGLAPLTISATGEYRPCFGTDDYARGVLGLAFDDPSTRDQDVCAALKLTRPETGMHYPDEDAIYIYKMHMAVQSAAHAHQSART